MDVVGKTDLFRWNERYGRAVVMNERASREA